MSYYLTDEHYAIAKGNGLNEGTVYQRVYMLGWQIPKAISTPVSEKTNWREWRLVAEQSGVSYQVFRNRVKKGWTDEEAASKPVKDKVEHCKELKNIRKRVFTDSEIQRAKDNGVSISILHKRVKRKWTVEEAINTPPLTQYQRVERTRHMKNGFRETNSSLFVKHN